MASAGDASAAAPLPPPKKPTIAAGLAPVASARDERSEFLSSQTERGGK